MNVSLHIILEIESSGEVSIVMTDMRPQSAQRLPKLRKRFQAQGTPQEEKNSQLWWEEKTLSAFSTLTRVFREQVKKVDYRHKGSSPVTFNKSNRKATVELGHKPALDSDGSIDISMLVSIAPEAIRFSVLDQKMTCYAEFEIPCNGSTLNWHSMGNYFAAAMNLAAMEINHSSHQYVTKWNIKDGSGSYSY